MVTTGTNALDGLDVVVEGEAISVTDKARLKRLAEGYIAKYDDLFVFHVRDGALWIDGAEDPARAYGLKAMKAFGFGKALQPDPLALLAGASRCPRRGFE